MRHVLSILTLTALVVVLAACGSSQSDDQELPTLMVLPTLTAEPEATPTQEAPEPTDEEVTNNLPADIAPPPFAVNTPQDEDTEELTENERFMNALMNQPQLPLIWYIRSTEPVNVYACPETTCDVLGTLADGDILEMAEPAEEEEEWHTITFEEEEAFVEVRFVVSAVGSGSTFASRPFDPSAVGTGPNSLPPGVTSEDMAAPPPVQGGEMRPPSDTSPPPGIVPNTGQSTPMPPFPPGAINPPGGGG